MESSRHSGRFFPYPPRTLAVLCRCFRRGPACFRISVISLQPNQPLLYLPDRDTISRSRSGGCKFPFAMHEVRVARVVSDQRVRGSEDQRIRGSEETRRIGCWFCFRSCPPSPRSFPVPAAFTSHIHRPDLPSCPTLHPLSLRTISTLSFRRLRSVAERRYVP
jgi:hypothetical protein